MLVISDEVSNTEYVGAVAAETSARNIEARGLLADLQGQAREERAELIAWLLRSTPDLGRAQRDWESRWLLTAGSPPRNSAARERGQWRAYARRATHVELHLGLLPFGVLDFVEPDAGRVERVHTGIGVNANGYTAQLVEWWAGGRSCAVRRCLAHVRTGRRWW